MQITPDVYYDLTPTETSALLKGADDRDVFTLRQTRRVATLLRNAHFKGNQSEEKYMPLPGDNDKKPVGGQYTDPEVAFMMLGSLMGGTITVEDTV